MAVQQPAHRLELVVELGGAAADHGVVARRATVNTARSACTWADRWRPRSGFQPTLWRSDRASPSTNAASMSVAVARVPLRQIGGAAASNAASVRSISSVDDGPPAGDGERPLLDDRRREPAARDVGDGEARSAGRTTPTTPTARRRRACRTTRPRRRTGSRRTLGTDWRRPLGSSSSMRESSPYEAGRVVPAVLGAAPPVVPEPAVEPRRRCGALAVPAPDVQRPRPPRALGDVLGSLPRHGCDPTDRVRDHPAESFPLSSHPR